MCFICDEEANPVDVARLKLARQVAADQAVQDGIKTLDNLAKEGVIPDGWHHRINLNDLDMESTTDCILGQLFEDQAHQAYLDSAGGNGAVYELSGYQWAQDEIFDPRGLDLRGFATGAYGDRWDELEKSWKYHIMWLRNTRD